MGDGAAGGGTAWRRGEARPALRREAGAGRQTAATHEGRMRPRGCVASRRAAGGPGEVIGSWRLETGLGEGRRERRALIRARTSFATPVEAGRRLRGERRRRWRFWQEERWGRLEAPARAGLLSLPSPRSAAKRLFFPLALELAALRGGDARRLRPFGRLRCFPAAPGNREGPVGRRAPELSWGAEPGVASGGVFRFGPVLHRRSVSPSFRGLDRGGGGFFAKGRVEATSGIFARPCLCGLVGTAREARRRGLVVPLCAVLRRRLLRPTRAARGGPLAARHWRGRRWGPEAGGLAWRWACVGPWQQLAPSLRAGPGPEDVSPKNLPPLFCRLRGLVYPFPGRAWRFPCAPVPRPLLTRFPPPLPFPLRLFPCVGV